MLRKQVPRQQFVISDRSSILVALQAFHTASLIISSGPLLAGWPQKARVPEEYDAGLLVGVAVTSFFAQLLMTRSLQLTAAARVSSTSFTQVWRVRLACTMLNARTQPLLLKCADHVCMRNLCCWYVISHSCTRSKWAEPSPAWLSDTHRLSNTRKHALTHTHTHTYTHKNNNPTTGDILLRPFHDLLPSKNQPG
jgi:hypothetical protein